MNEAFLALPLVELERLLVAVKHGKLVGPITEGALVANELASARPFVSLLAAFGTTDALRTFLECVVAQRRDFERSPRPELVWSGPEPEHGRARHTSVVIRELFEKARQDVFIAGYSFEGGSALLKPLHATMQLHKIGVELVLDCSAYDVYAATDPAEVLADVVREFFSEVWTFGEPRPRLYCDPRTLKRTAPKHGGGRWFPKHSMHAKCIVVDGQEALVGSANFTARAQSSNLEVGVVVRDRAFAQALLHQWNAIRGQLLCATFPR